MTGTFVLGASVALAQPTLTATGINPVIGESFTLNTSPFVSAGSAGASQTWDLSTMSGTSAGASSMVTPSSTANASSFPSSNVAWSNTTAGTVNYYKTTSTSLQTFGVVSGSTVIPYSNSEDILHFPFAYTNTYSDAWAGQFVSSGYTFYRTGTTTVTADGYGTLITPVTTYTNVMRVHFVEVYKDSAYVGVPYVITYNNDEYMWYRNGIHVQVAAVYTLTSSASASPYTGGTYVTGTVGINENDQLSSSSIFPNPASDQVTVDFTLTESKMVSVQIFNSIGQREDISQSGNGMQGENTMQLDVSTLSKGIYFAQIMLDGNVAATKRFVVTK